MNPFLPRAIGPAALAGLLSAASIPPASAQEVQARPGRFLGSMSVPSVAPALRHQGHLTPWRYVRHSVSSPHASLLSSSASSPPTPRPTSSAGATLEPLPDRGSPGLLTARRLSDGHFRIEGKSEPLARHRVQWTDDPVQGTWTDAETIEADAQGHWMIQTPTTGNARFFRVFRD